MSLIFLFVLGTAVGSFLNVLADRLPQDKKITGRSHCDYCKKTLQPLDLIPVLSFIFLKRRCRYCHKKLSWFYPVVEIVTGVAFVLTWIYAPALSISLKLAYLGLISCLIAIFLADIKYQIIPDQIQVALLLFTIFIVVNSIKVPSELVFNLLGALASMGLLLSLFLITRGRGMGFGDVKLAFTTGLLLGVKGGLIALYLAFVIGALYGLVLIIAKRKKLKSKIAFGPFIALGAVIVIFYQLQLYLFLTQLYGI